MRPLSDWLARRTARPDSPEPDAAPAVAVPAADAFQPSRVLPRFFAALAARPQPFVLDLGPVVGSNLSLVTNRTDGMFRVEDLHADIDRHAASGAMAELPAYLSARLPLKPGSVHGVLAWDVFDFLPRASAEALAGALTRAMAPDAVLFGRFNAALHDGHERHFTRCAIVDEHRLAVRPVPTSAVRQPTLHNRDILRVFRDLRVAETCLLDGYVRELLFRKPSYLLDP